MVEHLIRFHFICLLLRCLDLLKFAEFVGQAFQLLSVETPFTVTVQHFYRLVLYEVAIPFLETHFKVFAAFLHNPLVVSQAWC